MAEELSFRIRAINAVQRGVNGARRSLRGLGATAKRVGASMKAAFLGARVALLAVIAFVALSVRSFFQQEDAVTRVTAALRAHGDEVTNNVKMLKEQAAAMQAVSTTGDEAALTMMALLRNQGIEVDMLDRVTKGALGLSAAFGLAADASAKYTALAMKGDTQMLQRYIPALKGVTDEAEKQRIVVEAMNRGWMQAQEQAQNTGGTMKRVGNEFGDIREKIGEIASAGLGPDGMLAFLKDVNGSLERMVPTISKVVELLSVGNFFSKLRDAGIRAADIGMGVAEGIANREGLRGIAERIGANALESETERAGGALKGAGLTVDDIEGGAGATGGVKGGMALSLAKVFERGYGQDVATLGTTANPMVVTIAGDPVQEGA